ncbi:MAG TPA: diaminopimelate epimerase [Burkholderiales bacterium]|nr:diaminopimelate epimerase [Burkholderiales bacterium]
MLLRFTKMHGLGNDFVVFDATEGLPELAPSALRLIADRHLGVGCDQVLRIEAPRTPGTDFYYRIFNADGGEVEQCGNGARCFVRYVHDRGLTAKTEIRVGTRAGVIVPRLEDDGEVTVDMGIPEFEPFRIPFEAPKRALTYTLEVGGNERTISCLSMGNPHAVQVVPDVAAAPVATEGPLIERHPGFPQRVNAGYMQVLTPAHIRLRVYERGAGETLSCGTGACAAAVAGRVLGLLDSRVRVTTRGGDLHVQWAGEGHAVRMKGPAVTVFEGEIDLNQGGK